MTQKEIESARRAFTIAIGAFNFSHMVSIQFGGTGLDERGLQMIELHKQALAECEKENPDIAVIGSLITQMEIIASQKDAPKFPPGGIVNKAQ